MTAYVVWGPVGCDMHSKAERLRQALGCLKVVPNWKPGDPVQEDALMLTFWQPTLLDIQGSPCCAVEYSDVYHLLRQ